MCSLFNKKSLHYLQGQMSQTLRYLCQVIWHLFSRCILTGILPRVCTKNWLQRFKKPLVFGPFMKKWGQFKVKYCFFKVCSWFWTTVFKEIWFRPSLSIFSKVIGCQSYQPKSIGSFDHFTVPTTPVLKKPILCSKLPFFRKLWHTAKVPPGFSL